MRTDAPGGPAGEEAVPQLGPSRTVVDSFVLRPQGVAVYAVSGAPDQAPAGYDWLRLRTLLGLGGSFVADAMRALGFLNWRASHRFCGRCGTPLDEHPKEIARLCSGCGHVDYPALAPAVIVRVEKNGQILLARHVQRISNLWTCLAGYVELGESLENCVRREVREEVGIEISAVRYAASQSWPYPNQLMVGFVAQWQAGELDLEPTELLEARWFDLANLPAIPPQGTMAWRLIHGQFQPQSS